MSLYDNIIGKYFNNPKERPLEIVSPAQGAAKVQNIPTMEQHNPIFTKGGGALETMYKTLFKDQEPESAEEAAARDRREKRNSTLMALSDGLAGIANIWGTMEGASPMELDSLSAANRARYEYARRERDQNTDAWRRGVFNARLQDISARQASEKAFREAQEKEEALKYKKEQDKMKNDQWKEEFGLKQTQAKQKAELEAAKLEEQKKKNEADLKIRQRQVALAERKAEHELNDTSGSGIKKVVRFGLEDGTNITVPDDLKGSYVADVYNKMVDAAGGFEKADNIILSFMRYHYGQKEPGLSEMMTAVQLYKDKFTGIEDYMIERARQYTEQYEAPVAKDQPAPGSPGTSSVPIATSALKPNWGNNQSFGNQQSGQQPLTEEDLIEYLVE